MDKMIGYCGYSCFLCAARSDDLEVRQQLVDGWREIFGHTQYTAENVRCDGCKGDGRLADVQCKARPCAIERELESCALCNDFICDKVGHLLGSRDGMLTYLRERMVRVSKEEYELCVRQFESMPNLIELLANVGKLPQWTLRR